MRYTALAVLALAALVSSAAADVQRPLLTADAKVETNRVPQRLKACPEQQRQPQQRKQPSEFQRLYPEVRMIASNI